MANNKKHAKVNAPLKKESAVPQLSEPSAAGRGFSLLNFRVQAVILAIIGFVFYCNTFWHESALDDRMAITENEFVQRGLAGIPDMLTTDAYQSYLEHKGGSNQLAGGRYRPLSLITFAIEQQVMGAGNEGEDQNAKEARTAGEMHARHVVNVLLYMLSAIVLLFLLHNYLLTDKPILAFLAALIFTIHPIHTEVVANVKSRDEILSVLFICLTFIKAFRYKETLKKRDLVLALVCFFMALLSKEYAVTLVVLLPLSFYIFKNEPMGFSLKTSLLYLIPLGVYFLLRFTSVSAAAAGAEQNVMNNPYLYASPLQKIASEISILLNYLELLFYPTPLVADYSYNQIPYGSFSDAAVWLSLAIHVALIVSMFLLIKRRNVLGFAIAFYLVNLVLVSNLFFNVGAPMGERLIYHSSVGFAIAIAWLLYSGFGLLHSPSKSKFALGGLAVLLIAVSGYKTIDRNKDWKNDETLFLNDVKTSPNSVLVNNNAAAACMSNAKKNMKDAAQRNEYFDKAIKYFDKALAIYPKYNQARMNRGLCYFNMGNPEKALSDWDTVRKYNPEQQNLAKYLSIAGKYFFSQGMRYIQAAHYDSAIIAFNHSIDAVPSMPDPWTELGRVYYITGRTANAKTALEKALQIAPSNSDAQRLYEQVRSQPAKN